MLLQNYILNLGMLLIVYHHHMMMRVYTPNRQASELSALLKKIRPFFDTIAKATTANIGTNILLLFHLSIFHVLPKFSCFFISPHSIIVHITNI